MKILVWFLLLTMGIATYGVLHGSGTPSKGSEVSIAGEDGTPIPTPRP